MADLVGIATAAFQGIAALGTVAAAVGSLRAASQARDSVIVTEMTRHVDRLAAIADTVESLIGQPDGDGHAQRILARELASVEDDLPLCRRCASAAADTGVPQDGPALRREVRAALGAARAARQEYIRSHTGSGREAPADRARRPW
jgi:hypothetical protein